MLPLSTWLYFSVFASPLLIAASPIDYDDFTDPDVALNPDGVDPTANDQSDLLGTQFDPTDEVGQGLDQFEIASGQSPTQPPDFQTDNAFTNDIPDQVLDSQVAIVPGKSSGSSLDTSWVTGTQDKAEDGGRDCSKFEGKPEAIKCLYGDGHASGGGGLDLVGYAGDPMMWMLGVPLGTAVVKKVWPKVKKYFQPAKNVWDRVRAKQRANKQAADTRQRAQEAKGRQEAEAERLRQAGELERIYNNSPSLDSGDNPPEGSDKPSAWVAFFKSRSQDELHQNLMGILTDSGCPLQGILLATLAWGLLFTLETVGALAALI